MADEHANSDDSPRPTRQRAAGQNRTVLPASQRRWWLLATYLICMAALAAGLVALRQRTLAAHGTAAGQANWEAWRKAEQKNRDNPRASTQRKLPVSKEPPALVVMRDHFPAVLGVSLATATVMLGMVALAVLNVRPQGPGK